MSRLVTTRTAIDGAVQFSERAASAAIVDHTITWTTGAPTAGNAQTIANGASPSVAETGQSIQNINAKLNLVLAALRNAGIIQP